MSFVADCSVTLAWFAPDEDFRQVEPAFLHAVEHGFHVPFHWRAEFANGLLMMVRRKRATSDFPKLAFAQLNDFSIVTDLDGLSHVADKSVEIAGAHGLTIYDAIYVETSKRLGLPLATLDRRLAQAAAAENVEIIGVQMT